MEKEMPTQSLWCVLVFVLVCVCTYVCFVVTLCGAQSFLRVCPRESHIATLRKWYVILGLKFGLATGNSSITHNALIFLTQEVDFVALKVPA